MVPMVTGNDGPGTPACGVRYTAGCHRRLRVVIRPFWASRLSKEALTVLWLRSEVRIGG